MIAFARHAVLIALAAGLTWWIFLRQPSATRAVLQLPPDHALAVALASLPEDAPADLLSSPVDREQAEPTPRAEVTTPDTPAVPDEPEEPEEPDATDEPDEPDAEHAPIPPPSELGTPEGNPQALASVPDALNEVPAPAKEAPVAEDVPTVEEAPAGAPEEFGGAGAATASARALAEDLMADPSLLSAARSELSRESSQGFATVLLATPEDQLAIARFFGEELVLIPRSAIDPETELPRYFRITPEDPARPEAIVGQPPLAGYRQYRDLFDYEYGRLPAALRELRRSVLVRSEIYVFAALIPAREWSLIIGRRREALALSGRDSSEVRRFVLRYVRSAGGGFDVDVEEIVFTTGARFRPSTSAPSEKKS